MRIAQFVAYGLTLMISVGGGADSKDLQDPDALAHLLAVHEALGAASNAITECAKEGVDRRECICRNQDLVAQFRAATEALLTAHPEMADYATVNIRGMDGGTIAMNIPAITRQARAPLECA